MTLRTALTAKPSDRSGSRGFPDFRVRGLVASLLVLALSATFTCSGCRDASTSSPTGTQQGPAAADGQWQEQLFEHAIDNLNRLEDFNSGDMIQKILAQMDRLGKIQSGDSTEQLNPLRDCWPEPDMLRQIVARLNQWASVQSPPEWQLDPMVASLPKGLAQLPMLQDLGEMEFTRYDGFELRGIVWLRDVSQWARGDELDDLAVARLLFDWTVRNIQLAPPSSPQPDPKTDWTIQLPWETMFSGHGTAVDRAWVFMLLLRQQGIDAALLAIESDETLRPWAVGVIYEDKLYLFDPALGVPIPAPDGLKLDSNGQLDVTPATLAQVVEDENLLQQLDVTAANPYEVKPSDLKRVVALVEASPCYLSKRMKLVETRLVGDHRMVLTTAPSQQAKRFREFAQLADIRLWQWPYEAIRRRSHLDSQGVFRRLMELMPFYADPAAPLRKGRMLYLGGAISGQDGAASALQLARPSNAELETNARVLAENYFKMSMDAIRKLPAAQQRAATARAEAAAIQLASQEGVVRVRAKQDASYWLGLIAAENHSYASAVDYFMQRTIQAWPNGPWTHGAYYNLGRVYERTAEPRKAVETFRSDTTSPSYAGNLVRANWLSRLVPELKTLETKPATPGGEAKEPTIEEPSFD